MKTIAKQTMRSLGFEIYRFPVSFDPNYNRQRLLQTLEIDVVLDVGANVGQYAVLLRNNGYRGRIISFEPVKTCFDDLKNRAVRDELWECHPYALGADSRQAEIWISGTMSSVLNKSTCASESVVFAQSETQTIDIRALAEVWHELNIERMKTWLKMDVQGYEMEVLAGTGEKLSGVIAIETEMSHVPFYVGQPSWEDQVTFLKKKGFKMWSVTPGSRDSHHRMVEMDGVFVNEDLALSMTTQSC